MNVIVSLHQINGGCVGQNGERSCSVSYRTTLFPYCARSLDRLKGQCARSLDRLQSIFLFDVVEEDKEDCDRISFDEEDDESTRSQRQMVQYEVKRTPLLN